MQTVSFFILTYNRPDDLLAAIENILYFLDKPAEFFTEIVIVNNNSSTDYTAVETFIEKHKSTPDHRIIYIRNTENKGVAGGRNQAMEQASGAILISLDDDAEFQQKDTIQQVYDLFEKYKKEQVKVLTFKVNEPYLNNVYVASKSKDRHQKEELFTSYFAGGAHALDRTILDEVGYYDVEEKYGAEEYDLSYKILEKGYKIIHTNQLSILHKKSNQGRLDISKQSGITLKNKALIAYKYLPIFYFYSHIFFWSFFFLYQTRGNIFDLTKYIRLTLKSKDKITRIPVSTGTVEYIKSLGGRILY